MAFELMVLWFRTFLYISFVTISSSYAEDSLVRGKPPSLVSVLEKLEAARPEFQYKFLGESDIPG